MGASLTVVENDDNYHCRGPTPAQLDVLSQGRRAVKGLAASHVFEAAGGISMPIALGPIVSVGVLVAVVVAAA